MAHDGSLTDVEEGGDDQLNPDDSGSDSGIDSGTDAMPLGCRLTCDGCCLPDGGCSAPSSETCGGFGDVCEECLPPWICKGLVCFQEGVKNCGPTNCNGCCGQTNCFTGAHGATCGHGGGPCVTCLRKDGYLCDPLPDGGGGVCRGLVLCSPTTCNGCCAGDICATGTQDVACGTGGKACANCGLNFPHCVNGVCKE